MCYLAAACIYFAQLLGVCPNKIHCHHELRGPNFENFARPVLFGNVPLFESAVFISLRAEHRCRRPRLSGMAVQSSHQFSVAVKVDIVITYVNAQGTLIWLQICMQLSIPIVVCLHVLHSKWCLITSTLPVQSRSRKGSHPHAVVRTLVFQS